MRIPAHSDRQLGLGKTQKTRKSAKDRINRRTTTLRLETLEERCLFSIDGLAGLVSPAWFADVSDSAAAHAGPASWTGSSTGMTADQSGSQTNVYDWIVQFDAAAASGVASVAQSTALLAGSGIEFEALRGLGLVGQMLVRSRGASAFQVQSYLASNANVAQFELDTLQDTSSLANDPNWSRLWGLENYAQYGGRADADIDAEAAWTITTGSRSVVVAVLDTGIDYTHPDLAANVWVNLGEIAGNGVDDDGNGFVDDVHGYDFANNDSNPMDDNGHGTHVAGTIGAVGNNGAGVTGVNWTTSLMALKFLSGNGTGYLSDAVRAINYATMMRSRYDVNVRVLNNSWGGSSNSTALNDAIQASGNAGILFVAAAGNDGQNNDTTPHYPSNSPAANVIAVAASDPSDNLAGFSNYGAASVDLAAPGVSIYSTIPGGRYASYSGTSMATPHVAGVAALAWAVAPNASVAEIRAAILGGVDSVASLQGKTVTGGRLNAYNTLQIIGASAPRLPTIGSLAVSASPAMAGTVVTLSARGVASASGSVAGVSFYEDTNRNGQWDASDRLLGSDASIVGGEASITINTAGYALGSRSIFARAVGSQGQWSNAVSTTLDIIAYDDHGNRASAATRVAVNSVIAGALETRGDVDWFAFEAVAGRKYVLETTLGTLADTVLSLYGSDGATLLVWNDDGPTGYASRIDWTAAASGTYYLKVQPYQASQTGTYQLAVSAFNRAPVLAPIADRTMPLGQTTMQIALSGSDADGDRLAYTARIVGSSADAARLQVDGNRLTIAPRGGFVGNFLIEVVASDGLQTAARTFRVSVPGGDLLAALAYQLDQQHGLYSSGNYLTNFRGQGEKYLLGNGGQWFFLLPSGELHRWTGSIAASPLVATLSRAYYDNPSLLHNAQPAAATARSSAAGVLAAVDYVMERFEPRGRTSSWLFTVSGGRLQ